MPLAPEEVMSRPVLVLVVVVGRLEIGTPTECAGTAEGGKALPGPGLELARRK